MKELGFGRWSEEDTMRLIPLWLFPFLADEVETESLFGGTCYNKSDIDPDTTRFGIMSYGVVSKEG